MHEKMKHFEELLKRELTKEFGRICDSDNISPENIKTVKDAMKLLKLVDEYSGEGYSNRRGRSRTTGRYMSRDSYGRGSFGSYDGNSNRMYRDSYDSYERGYSGHSLVEKLERMYNEAQSEQERQMIDEWIHRAEMGQ